MIGSFNCCSREGGALLIIYITESQRDLKIADRVTIP